MASAMLREPEAVIAVVQLAVIMLNDSLCQNTKGALYILLPLQSTIGEMQISRTIDIGIRTQ